MGMLLRDLLWWDGTTYQLPQPNDVHLPIAGVVRLAILAPDEAPVVLIAKAGHNDENHNQNDVGSFILHVNGESLLTDPGPGLYTRDYFRAARYENVFCSGEIDAHAVNRTLFPPSELDTAKFTILTED